MKKGIITGLTIGLLSIWLVVGFQGCTSEFLGGALVGAGTSAAATEAQQLAQQKKTALIAKILELEAAVEAAGTPAEKAALEKELTQYKKQEEIANIVSGVTDDVREVLNRDWTSKDPNVLADNVHWLILAIGGYFGWEKKRSNDKNKKIEELQRENGKLNGTS